MKRKKYGLILIFLFIIICFKTDLFASYEDALNLFQEQKYSESLAILARELVPADDMKPDSPNYKLRFLAAHNHWKLGNGNSVIAHFRRCMDIKKDSVDPYVDLSLYFLEVKNYNDAEVTSLRGLKVKENAMLYYILGKISMVRKNFWRAKELLEKANSLNQEMYFSYNALGITLLYLNKYSEANTAFTVCYALKPDSYEIVNNLGMSYEKMGDNKKALRYYEKAEEIDKENATIQENIKRVKARLSGNN